jgi:cytochrome c-type biogenesis protein
VLLLLGAIVAGLLTAASPCVLPVLPVLLGGALLTAPSAVAPPALSGVRASIGPLRARPRTGALPDGDRAAPRRFLLMLTASLGASVVTFTLLLRATTLLLPVPRVTWSVLSGGLLILLGLSQVIPQWWERAAAALRLSRTQRLMPSPSGLRGTRTAVLAGIALGPVFSSCSPLYAYVVATVLPASAMHGLVLLLAYVAGLCGTLLVVGLAGRRAAVRLRWAAAPHGLVRRAVGVVLFVVGIAILLGADKTAETWAVENLPLTGLWTFDAQFLPRR